jgi:hypothetical protein
VNTRNDILEKLAHEIANKEKAEDDFHKLEIQMLQLKAEYERLDKRLKALTAVRVWYWREYE